MPSRLQGLDESILLSHLEKLAHELSIPVRYEPIRGEEISSPGGLCRIKGKYLIIIDTTVSIREKIHTLARALKQFDLSQVYLKPALREFLERLPRKETTA